MKTIPIVIQFKLYARANPKVIRLAIDDIAETYGVGKVELIPCCDFTSVTLQIPSIDLFKWAMLDDISEVCDGMVVLNPRMAGPTPTWETDYSRTIRWDVDHNKTGKGPRKDK
jgi:hypothetical protein